MKNEGENESGKKLAREKENEKRNREEKRAREMEIFEEGREVDEISSFASFFLPSYCVSRGYF